MQSRWQMLLTTYTNHKTFEDIDTSSGQIADLLDDLDHKHVSYEIYENKTNNGCTVFFDGRDDLVYV